ncbi:MULTISPECIES: DUF4168 domain-containing protein [unclassified Nodularia (in: cyanobacteria)]|uniref:DUF4168 domain-containing protein n=1 Tax=unclassified Nodularia (in: cyanobacteria) TaxID=2656917 RepID=UPI00187EC1DF|nr:MULTISPECIES: DUF4168 domain-containing protein [unclassified Nodularia (in: cyanobacteria)]MBE9201901.1 DUF4168 domain-containing protein [Nodularia sp. LEGE 06071]MCC2693132.1 DUF4168 domain-containing protein [Nodularia sp. LEGE 04288]
MLKQLVKSSALFVFLFAGNLSALAQAPESKPQTQVSQALQAQLQQPQGQTTVSPEELQQFASVIPTLQEIGQSSQQRSVKIIEQSGLSVERFQELSEAQQSPGAAPSSPATPQEQQSFNQVAPEIQSIQQETLSQQEEAVRAGGLEPNRFNEILVAIQQDPALQQQVQQLIPRN